VLPRQNALPPDHRALPSTDSEVAKVPGSDEHVRATQRPIRVLVVEDELFVALDAEAILSEAGCEVVGIATDANEASAKARQHLPDLIFMDIRLQGDRDGIDAAIEISQDLRIPIVFVTANVDALSDARGQGIRPLAAVTKPFTRESLLAPLTLYRYLPRAPHC
jgi:CheY-like chemotaxis protein